MFSDFFFVLIISLLVVMMIIILQLDDQAADTNVCFHIFKICKKNTWNELEKRNW